MPNLSTWKDVSKNSYSIIESFTEIFTELLNNLNPKGQADESKNFWFIFENNKLRFLALFGLMKL